MAWWLRCGGAPDRRPRMLWAGIEHLPPDLLDRGIPVHAVKPAEGGLGVNRLTCLLETLVQAAHSALADDRCFCRTQN